MPLEALRHEITPLGLHYLLVHYDIPVVDPATWRLTIGGRVDRALELSLDDLRAREPVTLPVTMECAGNGRARLEPRPVSQPWLAEAVGTAEWTGVPLAPLLAEAGLAADALEVVFTGLDRGVEGGVEQLLRAQPVDRRRRARRRPARLRVQRRAAAAAARLPAAPGRARLVRDDEREVAAADHGRRRAVRRLPDGHRLPDARARGRRGHAGHADRAAVADGPARDPRLPDPPPVPARRGRSRIEGRAWSGWGPIERVEVSTDGGASWHGARARRPARPGRLGAVVVRLGRAGGRARAVRPRARRDRPQPARRAAVERRRLLPTTRSSACR